MILERIPTPEQSCSCLFSYEFCSQEERDKKLDNEAAFRSWKESKADALKRQIREKKAAEKKQEEEEKKKIEKKLESDMVFILTTCASLKI